MSDSDDDRPLLQRQQPKASPSPAKPTGAEPPAKISGSDSDSEDDVPLAAKAQVTKEPAAPVAYAAPALKLKPVPVKRDTSDDSDSEDDKPILAKRPTPKSTPASKAPAASASKARTPSSASKLPSSKATSSPASAKKATSSPASAKKATSSPASAKKAPSSAAKAKGEKEVKPVKKFEMPGQTRETPPENDPLRAFYSSLYEQTDGVSDMAAKWMLMNGLFEREVAEATVERFKQLKAKAGGTPVKASPSKSGSVKPSPLRPGSSVKSTPVSNLKRKNSAASDKKVARVKVEKGAVAS